ncbi:MAG: histidine--tRNA ligase [Candidatus Cloacimonetes bacterium]|nr:histidine--tRNA ligase [Candidatus Cloacimonadota bacterium]MCF7813212.1 histidine--tRNA ligase [Candidatus Cloacimonadota bacterium]MCF7867411.1 histidine--tRNA ligase [Candidatus Cloacimonadota bacterium]MCF7882957.1 histidine--tRNA ligase [Candidatus Cloacimonadota bacterium]
MAKKYKVPRGTYDILPNESYKWQYIKKIFRETAEQFNFQEIVTPIFEQTDVFERSVGDSSDIVQKEMYRFQDKKGRNFALRPEGTASVVRSFVENNLGMTGGNSKLYYMGPMFRYDRPQKGRYRQFYQYGIENIGSDNPFIDAEVIAFGYKFLSNLELKNFELEINSIGCENCSKDYDKALVEYFTPNLDKLCSDCKTRIDKNPKRLLDCKVPTCKEIATDAPDMFEYLDEECKTHFEEVKKYLNQMKIPFKVNPKIVRGLDYYNKTAFEFLDNNLGAQNALIGGGRYNGLVRQFGGRETPGIGFAGGFERLILSMETEKVFFGELPKPDVFLVLIGDEAKNKAADMLLNLRTNNIKAEYNPDKESLKAQMKAADKENARFTIIIGEDEIKKNIVVVKNMQSGEQQDISAENLVSFLQSKTKK